MGVRGELGTGGRGGLCEKRRFSLTACAQCLAWAIPAGLAQEMFREVAGTQVQAPSPPQLWLKIRALVSHTCWPGDPPRAPSVLEKPTSHHKTGCAAKPGCNLPSSAPGFSQGVVYAELVPEPLPQAGARHAHDGEPLPAGTALMVGAGPPLPRCAKARFIPARQSAGSEVGRRGTSTGREGGGGVRVLQPQTERAGFFPTFFSFLLFCLFKKKKTQQTNIKKTPKLLGAPQKTKEGPAAAAPLCAGGMFPGARHLPTSFESALGLAPHAAAPPATFLVKCAWIGL